MSILKLNRQEAFAFAGDGELIKIVPSKWGIIRSYVLEEDWVYRRMDVRVTEDGWSTEDGETDNFFEAYEVKPVEKIVIDWVKV